MTPSGGNETPRYVRRGFAELFTKAGAESLCSTPRLEGFGAVSWGKGAWLLSSADLFLFFFFFLFFLCSTGILDAKD